jgi:hypothetical protein
LGAAFEKFVQRKWRDALHVAAAEPSGQEVSGGSPERAQAEKAHSKRVSAEKTTCLGKKTTKITGATNVVTTGTGYRGRRCRFYKYTGCTEDHAAAACKEFRGLNVETRKKALDNSEFCTFCLRHSADSECYGKGLGLKPTYWIPECMRQHAEKLQEMMAGLNVSANAVMDK